MMGNEIYTKADPQLILVIKARTKRYNEAGEENGAPH